MTVSIGWHAKTYANRNAIETGTAKPILWVERGTVSSTLEKNSAILLPVDAIILTNWIMIKWNYQFVEIILTVSLPMFRSLQSDLRQRRYL